jgi:hypothetical protein
VGAEQDRAVRPFADREVDRAGGTRGQRDGDLFTALAHDPQGTVTAFDVQVCDVGTQRFGDPQPFNASNDARA